MVRRWFWLTLVLVCMAVPPVAHAEEQVEPYRDPATVQAAFEEACALVEELCGAKFRKQPKVVISDVKTVHGLLADELAVLTKLGYDAGEVLVARRVLSEFLLAKYDPESHSVHLVPETIAKIAEGSKALEGRFTRNHLRLLLAHEATHALDFERFELAAAREALKDRDGMLALGAVMEGHAEWVADLAAARWKLDAELQAMRHALFGTGIDTPEDMSAQVGVVLATMRFAYVQGRSFFEAVHAARGRDGVEKALAQPPARSALIERPALWLDPDAAPEPAPLQQAIASLEPMLGVSPWVAQSQPMLDVQLRSLGAQLPESIRATFLEGLEGAHVTVAQVPGEDVRAIVMLVAFDSVANAQAFDVAQQALQKANAERMADQVESEEVSSRDVAGTEGTIPGRTRHVRVTIGPLSVDVHHVTFRVGRVCGEVVLSNVPSAERKHLDQAVDTMAAWLADPAAAAKRAPLALLPVEPTARTIEVRVVDEEGKPVPVCTVVLSVEGGSHSYATQARCLEGTCSVRIEQEGTPKVMAYRPTDAFGQALDLAPSGFTTVEDDATSVELVMPAGVTVAGRVVDADGAPVAEAQVFGRSKEESWIAFPGEPNAVRATTDADGRFTLRGVGGGDWELVVRREGAELLPGGRAFRAGDGELTVQLPELHEVTITVLDEEGAPVVGVPVYATPAGGGMIDAVDTGVEGRAVLRGLDPTQQYSLHVAESHGQDSPWISESRHGWKPSDTEIVLKRGWILRVRVVDEEGKPSAGTVAWRTRGFSTSRSVGPDGMATIAGVPREGVEVVAYDGSGLPDWNSRDALPWQPIEPTGERITLTLSKPDPDFHILVRVVGPEGAPVPSAQVWMDRLDEHGTSFSGMGQSVEAAGGRFPRPDGPFRIRAYLAEDASGKPLAFGPGETAVLEGDMKTVVVRLGEARRITGVVVDPAGAPVPRAQVHAYPVREGDRFPNFFDHHHVDEAVTDAEGRYELVRVGPGPARLVVKPPAGFVAPGPVTVAPDETDVRIATAASLSVTVLDWQGKPVAGARVEVRLQRRTSSSSWSYENPIHANTDAEGRARIRRFEPDEDVMLRLRITGPRDRTDLRPHVQEPWDGQTGGEIRLERGIRFRGRVLLEGKPAAEALVLTQRAGPDGTPRWVPVGYVQDDGSFETEVLPYGARVLRAETSERDWRLLAARSPGVEATPDAPEVTLRIERGKEHVTLRVPGVPEGTVGWMTFEDHEDDARHVQFIFEADDVTTVKGLLPGTWSVYVPAIEDGTKCVWRTGLTLPAKSFDLELVDTITLRFRLQAPEGATEVHGTARAPAMNWLDAVKREDGVYEVRGMPPGRWHVGGYAKVGEGYVEGGTEAGPDEVPTIVLDQPVGD